MYYLQNLADFDFLPHDRLQLILLGNYRTTTKIRKEIRKMRVNMKTQIKMERSSKRKTLPLKLRRLFLNKMMNSTTS